MIAFAGLLLVLAGIAVILGSRKVGAKLALAAGALVAVALIAPCLLAALPSALPILLALGGLLLLAGGTLLVAHLVAKPHRPSLVARPTTRRRAALVEPTAAPRELGAPTASSHGDDLHLFEPDDHG